MEGGIFLVSSSRSFVIDHSLELYKGHSTCYFLAAFLIIHLIVAGRKPWQLHERLVGTYSTCWKHWQCRFGLASWCEKAIVHCHIKYNLSHLHDFPHHLLVMEYILISNGAWSKNMGKQLPLAGRRAWLLSWSSY